MSAIRIELEKLLLPAAPAEAISPVVKKFLTDMDRDRSSFFHLPQSSKWHDELSALQPVLSQRIPEVDTFLHLGIGGSSLGAETIVRALEGPNAPAFHFFDNIDPDWVWSVLERCSPERALVYVVSKSGTTMETLAQFALLKKWLEQHLGERRARDHMVFCTDPAKGTLRELASLWNVPCFAIPPNLGGRFSALSAVGLFPALVAGADTHAILAGAAEYRAHFLNKASPGQVPEAADLAYRLVQAYREGGRNVTALMPYSQRLKPLSAFFTQLWSESLGKEKKGITPLSATGVTDQHSVLQLLRDGPQDKVVGFVEITGFQHILELRWTGPLQGPMEAVTGITLNQLMDAEFNATRQVLTNNERPHFTLVLPRLNANTLGQTLYFLELLTALAGYFLGIDPFDQPGVEEGKRITSERIRACKKNSVA